METEKKQLVNRTEIFKTLGPILEPWLDDMTSLDERTDLLIDIGLDSVAILQMVLNIEDKFNITIKDSELDSGVFSKMSNLIDIIEDKVNEAN